MTGNNDTKITFRQFDPVEFEKIFTNAKPGTQFLFGCSPNLDGSEELREDFEDLFFEDSEQ